MLHSFSIKNQKGFTLIELLTVISIIALLSSVILASLNNARGSASLAAKESFQASVDHSVRDQLAGEWTFNNSANPLADTSGFGNDGTCSGSACPTYAATGGYDGNGAESFDGSNDAISCGTNSNLYGAGYTLSLWFQTGSSANISPHMLELTGTDGHTKLTLSMLNNQPNLGWVVSGSGVNLSTNVTANDGAWHNFVGVTDGTNFIVYLDGIRKNSMTSTLGTAPIAHCYIGEYSNGGPVYFAGTLDDVRIYTEPFNLSQVQELYAEGKAAHTDIALR